MFPLRKRSASAPVQAAPKAASSAAPATARDQAKALLSMLEAGSAAGEGAIPPDRLRDIARDLIAKVEARGTPAKAAPSRPARAAPPPAPAPAIRPRAQRPLVSPKTKPVAAPAPSATTMPSIAPATGTAVVSDELPSPMVARSVVGVDAPAMSSKPLDWARDRKAVRKIVVSAFRPEDAAAEHPAIVALDLAGRPPREQAERLRLIPAGRVRATHRHLMLLERTGS